MKKNELEKINFISLSELPQSLLQDPSTVLAFEEIFSQVGTVNRPATLIADIHKTMASVGFLPMGKPFEYKGEYENVRLEFRSNVGDLKINEYKYCNIYIHMLPLCAHPFLKYVTKIVCTLTMYNRKQTRIKGKKELHENIIARYRLLDKSGTES